MNTLIEGEYLRKDTTLVPKINRIFFTSDDALLFIRVRITSQWHDYTLIERFNQTIRNYRA